MKMTPLHEAACENSVNVAELLIAAGAALDANDMVSCPFGLLLLNRGLAWCWAVLDNSPTCGCYEAFAKNG